MLNNLGYHNLKNILRRKFNLLRYSTKSVLKEQEKDPDNLLHEFQTISPTAPRQRTQKPQKPPFAKNLLLGIVDTDILAYPERNNETVTKLEGDIKQAKAILEQLDIKECSKASKQFLKKLANAKLLGLQAPQMLGGQEMTVTEICRFTEAMSVIELKYTIINNENLGIQTLVKFGSDELKRKYLQPLINGDCLSAFCIVNPVASNIDLHRRTALLARDGKTWLLNGEKKLVVSGSDADIYIVFAHTNSVVKDELQEPKYTAFVVERDFGGITSTQQSLIDSDLKVADVVFENTPIPVENAIGQIDTGSNILTAVYPQHHLSVATTSSAFIKTLINNITEHYIKMSQQPYLLHETETVQSKIGELVTSSYAVESMVYLTAGLIDDYENQDCELECAITKVFASEQALLSSVHSLDLVEEFASLEQHWCSKFYKEALCHVTLNDNNDKLKLVIGLFGLRHAGFHINELVKKLRNPYFHVNFVFKRLWTHRKQVEDNPRLNLNLYHHLHPSCIPASQRLEYCVLRLQFATEALLARCGQDVLNKHADLRRLADCVIDIYAMTASISRASRSYCIGLQHSDLEMTLANAFTVNAMERVKQNVQKILQGPYETNDESYKQISEKLFSFKGYFPAHPLTRNF